MRRVRVNRRQEKPLEQRYLELKKELEENKKENWDLRTKVVTLTQENDDLKGDYQCEKNNRIKADAAMRQLQETHEITRKIRNRLEDAYENALEGIGCMSEEWYDRHLDQTGNVLMKEPFGVEYED